MLGAAHLRAFGRTIVPRGALAPFAAQGDSRAMSELAGSLGDGRVLVLQPATPNGAGLDIALGIQRFWQKTLKHAGRPAATIMALTRVEAIEGVLPDGLPIAVGDKGVALFKDWADEVAVAALVLQRESRWGLAATFDASPRAATLATVLLEAKAQEPPRVIARRTFVGGYAELPEHVCSVLVDVARRLGTKLPWAHAPAAFDTDQPAACMLTLEQMGVLSMAEDSCRLKIDPCSSASARS